MEASKDKSVKKQLEESIRYSHIVDNLLKDRELEVQRLTTILTQLQNTSQETSDRYEQKLVRLQDKLIETEQQLDTAKEQSDLSEQKLVRLQGKLTETEQQLNTAREQSERYEQKIIQLQTQLTEKEQIIAAMMTSKFWKIRSIWFKLKNSLGIKDE